VLKWYVTIETTKESAVFSQFREPHPSPQPCVPLSAPETIPQPNATPLPPPTNRSFASPRRDTFPQFSHISNRNRPEFKKIGNSMKTITEKISNRNKNTRSAFLALQRSSMQSGASCQSDQQTSSFASEGLRTLRDRLTTNLLSEIKIKRLPFTAFLIATRQNAEFRSSHSQQTTKYFLIATFERYLPLTPGGVLFWPQSQSRRGSGRRQVILKNTGWIRTEEAEFPVTGFIWRWDKMIRGDGRGA
jgi:hypothetical protein